jgi:beta-galactosidase
MVLGVSATVAAEGVRLRPQVAEWEREVPVGAGVTGLWRPIAVVGSSRPDPLQLAVSGDTLYTLIQIGGTLTGRLEAPAGGFGPGGGAVGGPIEGKVDGKNFSFRAGTTTYTGTISGDQIELRKMSPPWPGAGSTRPIETGSKPAIGPLPDGSDPSPVEGHSHRS